MNMNMINASSFKLKAYAQVLIARWVGKPDVMLQEFYKLLKAPYGLTVIQEMGNTKIEELLEDLLELCKESGADQEKAQSRGISIINFVKSYDTLHHILEKKILLSQVNSICKELLEIQKQLSRIPGSYMKAFHALELFFNFIEQLYQNSFSKKIDSSPVKNYFDAIPQEEIKDLIIKAKESFKDGSFKETASNLTTFIQYCEKTYPNWIESRLLKQVAVIRLYLKKNEDAK